MKPLYKPELEHLVGKIKADLNSKQDKLTAGENVVIANNTISATDTVYDDTAVQAELGKKADKTYVDNKVKTDVPLNAKFTDTIVDISGKQDKLTAGNNITITNNTISATDTVYDDTSIQTELGKKADKTYVDNKVKTDVPENAKFTDTVYTHPASHPASMITGLPNSLPADGGNADTVGGFTVGVNVPADAVFTDTDTVTTINGKTGAISKADIVALGIPAQDTVYTHPSGTNPHGTTKADVGLSNVDNTSDSAKPISTATQTALDKKVDNTKVLTDVPANAEFTDTKYTAGDNVAISEENKISATNTTYTEITTTEIDTGTASTLRTITGRRVKYILDKVQGWIGGLTKSDVGLSNVDNIKQMPISSGVLENYREKLTTVSAANGSIDLSLGNVFVHTPSGNTTYSITNAVSGQAHSFTLIINMGSTVRTLTFPESVIWQGGEIPDMTTPNKTYVLTFLSINGGFTWLGMFGGEF